MYRLEDHKPCAEELAKLRSLEAGLATAQNDLEKAKSRVAAVEEEDRLAVQKSAEQILAGGAPIRKPKKNSEARREAQDALEEAEYQLKVFVAAVERQRQRVNVARKRAEEKLREVIRQDHEAVAKKLVANLRIVSKIFAEEANIREEAMKIFGNGITSFIRPVSGRLNPGPEDEPGSFLNLLVEEMKSYGYNI